MKKILVIIVLYVLVMSASYASDEIVLERETNLSSIIPFAEISSSNISKISQAEMKFESCVQNDNTHLFSKSDNKFYDELSKTVHNLYNLQIENTNRPACLLKEPLTNYFETGPLESIHTWGVVQMNNSTLLPEYADESNKFNIGLINALIDGQFRGGKENFRIMFDPTPIHDNFFKRFIQDLYVESHRIPHHTVLIGNSRPGVGIEGSQSPYTLPFVNRSQISRNFGNARKFGIRLKGNYSLIDYDLGGYSSDTFFTEFFPGAEFNGWINFKPLGKTDGRYGKLITGGGIAGGQRNSVDFFVAGAYLGYEYKKIWIRMECANADGSNGASGLTSKKRQGWYTTIGYHITKKLEAVARYDEFDPDKTISNNNQREYSCGFNYYIKGQALKLILNYVFCQNENKPDSHRIIVGTQIAF